MPDNPSIEVVNNEAAGRFEAHLGDAVAFAEYRRYESGIMMPHTEVPPAFEGRGVGKALVEAALAFIRAEGQLVIPTCPFVSAYIARHPEHQDLVHPHYRSALGLA